MVVATALAPVLVTPPAELPVSLEIAKAHLRIFHEDDDDYIEVLIEAAAAHFDGWAGTLGRCIVTQTWRVSIADWPASGIVRLPFPNVSAVAVAYSDEDDAEQTVSAALYSLHQDDLGAFIDFKAGFNPPDLFDRRDAVRISVTAGFGDADAVPKSLKLAVLMLVASWYENREAVVVGQVQVATLPMGVETLTRPYRWVCP